MVSVFFLRAKNLPGLPTFWNLTVPSKSFLWTIKVAQSPRLPERVMITIKFIGLLSFSLFCDCLLFCYSTRDSHVCCSRIVATAQELTYWGHVTTWLSRDLNKFALNEPLPSTSLSCVTLRLNPLGIDLRWTSSPSMRPPKIPICY